MLSTWPVFKLFITVLIIDETSTTYSGVQFHRRYDIEDTELENYLKITDDNNILLEVFGYDEYELDIYARYRLLTQLITGVYDTPSKNDKDNRKSKIFDDKYQNEGEKEAYEDNVFDDSYSEEEETDAISPEEEHYGTSGGVRIDDIKHLLRTAHRHGINPGEAHAAIKAILSAPYSDDFISHLLPCISNCIISKGHHSPQHDQGNDNDKGHSTVNPIQFIVYPDHDHGRGHQQDVDLISFCHQSCMNAMLHSHVFASHTKMLQFTIEPCDVEIEWKVRLKSNWLRSSFTHGKESLCEDRN